MYSLHTWKECRFGQRHGLQNLTLTSYFYKNIYHKMIYLYFYESIFQDKSIHIVFVFWNSTTRKLFIIYILNVWLKSCPKQHSFRVWREYMPNQSRVDFASCTIVQTAMISVTEGKIIWIGPGHLVLGRYTWTPMHLCKEWSEMKPCWRHLLDISSPTRYLISEEHTGCTGKGRSYHSNKE